MLSATSNRNQQTLSDPFRQVGRTLGVCVVGPQSTEAREWSATADSCRLHFVASAEEALRLARAEGIDLWVVNTTLPGLSGCELCGMLKSRNHQAAVCLVADEYSPEVEQAAWKARATMFGVQGEQQALVTHWIAHKSGKSQASAVRS